MKSSLKFNISVMLSKFHLITSWTFYTIISFSRSNTFLPKECLCNSFTYELQAHALTAGFISFMKVIKFSITDDKTAMDVYYRQRFGKATTRWFANLCIRNKLAIKSLSNELDKFNQGYFSKRTSGPLLLVVNEGIRISNHEITVSNSFWE